MGKWVWGRCWALKYGFFVGFGCFTWNISITLISFNKVLTVMIWNIYWEGCILHVGMGYYRL